MVFVYVVALVGLFSTCCVMCSNVYYTTGVLERMLFTMLLFRCFLFRCLLQSLTLELAMLLAWVCTVNLS